MKKEMLDKIFKEKYPKGLSAEYTKEEMVGYMMAINDVKELLTLANVSESFYCEKQTNLLKQCAIECDYCKSLRDI